MRFITVEIYTSVIYFAMRKLVEVLSYGPSLTKRVAVDKLWPNANVRIIVTSEGEKVRVYCEGKVSKRRPMGDICDFETHGEIDENGHVSSIAGERGNTCLNCNYYEPPRSRGFLR